MQLAGLTVDDIKENLAEAQARLDDAVAEYQAAKQAVAWLQQGLRLLDPKAAAEFEAGRDQASVVADLFPNGFDFEDSIPTLRQAIILVMRNDPIRRQWAINDLATALNDAGWLPVRDDATKRVSDMAGVMYGAGQLSRPYRGTYELSPPLAAALDAVGGDPP